MCEAGFRRHHLLEAFGKASEERAGPAYLRVGDEQARFGVAQDAGLPAQVVLELGAPERRMDRDGGRTGQQHAEERVEECRLGRQHERHPVAAADAPQHQAVRDGARVAIEIPGRAGVADQAVRQAHLELTVKTRQQLGAAEAVEARVAIEVAVEIDGRCTASLGTQFDRQLPHDGDGAVRDRLILAHPRFSHLPWCSSL